MTATSGNSFGRPTRPPIRPANVEIDLHGMFVKTAVDATERHLQDAHADRLHIVKIIHGHGTGAVKTAVHAHLKKSPLVKKFYLASYGDGGTGVTIAELDYGQRGSYNSKRNNSIVPRAERWK